MDFITEEIVKQHNFTPEQIEAIKPLYENNIANLKKDWDGVANANAEKILDGAGLKVAEVTKVPRNQGEKIADYIVRAHSEHLTSLKSDLETKKAEYDQKLKDFKGDEATKAELDKIKGEYDEAKKKLANYDELSEKAGKYEQTAEALSGMKLSVAYNSVKPNFPTEANQYEVKAKWDEFIKATNEKWLIEIVDNEPIAIDKDNEHKRVKLSELVSQNKEITELLQGRQQKGSGANPAKTKVDGLPFEIEGEPTSANLSKAINTYLTSQGTPVTSDEWGKKFQELFNKAQEALKK
jgi:hypothetical protein